MAEGPGYEVPLRRRREGRTDYGKRLKMLKSGKHRAVVRIANNNARVQIVGYGPDGDETVASAFAPQLEAFGWDHHRGNIPAAYLTGFLAGKRAIAEGVDGAIADIGVYERQGGSRYYAAVQGLQDAGLAIDADEAMFPVEERVTGGHAAAYESDGMDAKFAAVRDAIESEYGG